MPAQMALGLLWLVLLAVIRPISMPDEGRYAGVARDMVVYSDWLVPRQNGMPFFHKPPMFYWLDAFAMSSWGVNLFTIRFASLTAAALTLVMFFVHLRHSVGSQHPLLRQSLVVWLLAPLPVMAAQYANLDMTVAGMITATIVCWAHASTPVPGSHWPLTWARLGWFFAALGLLSKGLIGVALPLLVVGPWGLWRVWRALPDRASRNVWPAWRAQLAIWLNWPALVGFAVLTLPWFLVLEWRFPGFNHYFFIDQQVSRYVGQNFNNAQPALFYIVVLILLMLPWSLWWLLAAARRVWPRLAQWGADAPDTRATGDASAAVPREWLALWLWWLVAITLFFSVPNSKLVGYILPVMLPVVVLTACILRSWPDGALKRRVAGTAFALIVLLPWIFVGVDHKSLRDLPQAINARIAAHPAEAQIPLVFFEENRRDLNLLTHTRVRPWIVHDWREEANTADNWAKELLDGRRFDPAMAAQVLVMPQDLRQRLCAVPLAWLVVDEKEVSAPFANLARQYPNQLQALARESRRGSDWVLYQWKSQPGC
ncbi:ArnT family glycosyltransferase [Amphibiibacter pelophylacis]|uniref:Phospholipid carrier-dependent glycosyltransferase n=1 Tax=Amphibiibacter pelophylacis TaxID=1799477 RepID=A0ACC6P2Z3_9BURK